MEARQFQVQCHFQQLRLHNAMTEEGIGDVGRELSSVMIKIEKLIPQCHQVFQTNRQEILYLCDAVAEFSEWSLEPIENINAQSYTFNQFVTALHQSIQTKAKVQLMSGEPSRIAGHASASTHTLIGQYSRNPCHLRWELQRSRTDRSIKFD